MAVRMPVGAAGRARPARPPSSSSPAPRRRAAAGAARSTNGRRRTDRPMPRRPSPLDGRHHPIRGAPVSPGAVHQAFEPAHRSAPDPLWASPEGNDGRPDRPPRRKRSSVLRPVADPDPPLHWHDPRPASRSPVACRDSCPASPSPDVACRGRRLDWRSIPSIPPGAPPRSDGPFRGARRHGSPRPTFRAQPGSAAPGGATAHHAPGGATMRPASPGDLRPWLAATARALGEGAPRLGGDPHPGAGVVRPRSRDATRTAAYENEKSPPEGGLFREIRRRPTLPEGIPSSTIGAGGLNFRVRNGNGCDTAAMATGNRVELRGEPFGGASRPSE